MANILWTLVEGRPQYIFWNYFLNIIEFNSFGWLSYCWFCYSCNFVPDFLRRWPRIKQLAVIPVVLVTVLISTTRYTQLLFYVDALGFYHRGRGFLIQQFSYIYLIAASVISLFNLKNAKFISQKKHLLIMTSFIVAPGILSVAQLFFPPVVFPTMQYSVLISMLLMFANEQEREITHDSLTKLANRFEFERILDDRMNRCRRSKSRNLFLLVGDIDHFKFVNDTLGHQQGDVVLREIGSVLKLAAQNYDTLVARISGDEFGIVFSAESERDVLAYIEQVTEDMKGLNSTRQIPVSISLGYARFNLQESMAEFLERADQEMYQVKRRHKGL